jgi:hypothetical protein
MKEVEFEMENRSGVLSKKPKKSTNKQIVTAIVVTAILVALVVFGGTWYWAFTQGRLIHGI